MSSLLDKESGVISESVNILELNFSKPIKLLVYNIQYNSHKHTTK